ncbi:hypothetical protein ABZY57_27295 [Streptomyces sp. NPDC006450]|uniref:hypothetical protein n=1 Tax=Streptomyces sp. NPDC006450 TaxID=3155458 RepID=UPI0033B4A5D8
MGDLRVPSEPSGTTEAAAAPGRDPRAGDAEWMLPVLVLVPASIVRQFTDHSAPWLVVSWVCCVLAAVFLAVGWGTVRRHGMRNRWGWVLCTVAHIVFAGQISWLASR